MFSTMDTGTAIALAVFATAPIALLAGAAVWLKRR
jgi:hypothetical protein